MINKVVKINNQWDNVSIDQLGKFQIPKNTWLYLPDSKKNEYVKWWEHRDRYKDTDKRTSNKWKTIEQYQEWV